MVSETTLAIQAAKRLNLPSSARLRLQTYIDTALNVLARQTVNDYQKRRLMMSDKTVVQSTITSSSGSYYTDISTITDTYGIMPEYLQYGTLFWQLTAKTFIGTDVNTGNDRITILNHGMSDGTRVWLSSTSTIPAPLTVQTNYYVFAVSVDIISLCATYADAIARQNVINLTNAGTGVMTVTPQDVETVQWIDSPEFAQLENDLPISYIYGYLLSDKIYFTGVTTGTISYAVPFVPTIDDFNDIASLSQLENDLVDAIVQVAVSAGLDTAKVESEK